MFLKPISIQRANNIKVIDGSHPIGILGYIKGGGGRIKKLTIACSSFAPSLVPFRKTAQLCMKNTRLQRVESAVVSFHLVIILAQLAMVPEHADFSSNVFVIRGNSTCFATGSEVLAWVIASVVAINVRGTVRTISPGRMPAAIRANRRASVPLPTPMQNCESQKRAKSCSNSSTIEPPTKLAERNAERKTETSSSSSSW